MSATRRATYHLSDQMVKREKVAKGNSPSAVSLVIPSLYLGPVSAASSQAFLSSASITHVLSVGASPTKPVEGITYNRISITDSPSSSITKVCDTACDIIDEALKSRNGAGKILVHCSAGISRSPMVVAAYLIRRRNMSLREALRQIVVVRPQVSPNSGFWRQLKELELEVRGEVSLDVDELPKREKDRLALLAPPQPAESAAAVVEECS
ncbi:hypothetical protein H2248_004447 [Termitomyces sp. 'cryptogamus']|nr:hypothetical protein H2248_004447 [Termitomyces sp. 'cryptogamus']